MKIKLKDKSPEYWDPENKVPIDIPCAHEGCMMGGDYKAPASRALNSYYHFCLDHVREYNKKWNYFDGMSEDDIADYINNATTWERETYSFHDQNKMERFLRNKLRQDYFSEDGPSPNSQKEHRENVFRQTGTPEGEAMAIMDLYPPLTLADIKTKYKQLVKKHHPDANGGDKESEEILKKINMAYTVLKLAYESYETLRKKETV